jgi:hypothetical protein
LSFFQGFGVVGEALETAQFAEGLVDLHALVDGDLNPIDRNGLDVKRWLFVVFAEAVNQVVSRSDALGQGRFLQW